MINMMRVAILLMLAWFASACPTLAQQTQTTQSFSGYVQGLPVINSLAGNEKIFALQNGAPMTTTPSQLSALVTFGVLGSITGDCTSTAPPAVYCTKTQGVPFAPSATIDTTDASKISSGTLPAARLPYLAASATTDTTDASNITSGTLSAALLPFPDPTNASNITSGTLSLGHLALPQAQFHVGNTSNNPAPLNMSGDCGLAYTGAVTCLTSAGNTIATTTAADQTLSGGANVASLQLASGSIAIDCGSRPLQWMTAPASAWTITTPGNDGSCMLMISNSTSGSPAPTFSGFSVGTNTGDAVPTAASYRYMVSIVRIAGISTYSIKALQ